MAQREVIVRALSHLAAPVDYSAKPFVCLVAVDASSVSVADASQFCARLLDLGCVYFCAWGPDCERLHDIMDEELLGPDPPDTMRDNVMTTWHADEPLTKALDFCFDCTGLDDLPILLLAVGSDEWTNAIERYVAARLA